MPNISRVADSGMAVWVSVGNAVGLAVGLQATSNMDRKNMTGPIEFFKSMIQSIIMHPPVWELPLVQRVGVSGGQVPYHQELAVSSTLGYPELECPLILLRPP